MSIGGGEPNDTNHTPTAQMKTQTKFAPGFTDFLETLKKYNRKIESDFPIDRNDHWCGTTFRLNFQRGYNYFNQHDAEITEGAEADIPVGDGVICQSMVQHETLEGTSNRDYFKIGQRDSQVDNTLYGTTIYAGADNDIIDNRHQNTLAPYLVQSIRAFGGEGIDHFKSIASNSAMAVMDMEVGESFTMHESFEFSEVAHLEGVKEITYASEDSFDEFDVCGKVTIEMDLKHYMVIPANATVDETIVNGNKVVTVVPEIDI